MLRVFQVPESDARIYSRELKNFEVETLFQKYRERLHLRVNSSICSSALEAQSDSGPSSLCSNASSGFGSNSPSCSNTQDGRMLTADDPTNCAKPSASVKSEEDLCPICLLDMVDGESLVICTSSCRNRLHHHCMAIWALECAHQGEPVLCPLCRQEWTGESAMRSTMRSQVPLNAWTSSSYCTPSSSTTPTAHEKTAASFLTDLSYGPQSMLPHTSGNSSSSSSSHVLNQQHKVPASNGTPKSVRKNVTNCSHPMKIGLERRGSTGTGISCNQGCHKNVHLSLSSSSVCSCFTEDVTLPHTEAIPPEQSGIAGEWVKVFGVDLVCCLFSRDWKAREIAFRRLKSDVSIAHLSDNEEYQHRILSCCAKILAAFAADPVYKVYEAWVRCLQVMLNHARCRAQTGDAEDLQKLVRPIVRALLLKCADGNRRTSQLSIDVLLELSKGQEGDLAIGTQLSPSCSVDEGQNLNLVLGCILEDGMGEVTTSSWQWLAGRLVMLDRLLHTFQDEFFSLTHNPNHILGSGGQRLVGMLEFCANALKSTHVTVNRLARHLFVALVNVAIDVKYSGPLQRVCQLIGNLEPTLQARLRKVLHHSVPQSPVCESGRREGTPTTPQMTRKAAVKSDVSPARSTLPQHVNPPALPPKSTRLVAVAASPPRPRDLDLSRARTKRPVKFQHLPGIGSPLSTPNPATPLMGGISPKRSGPTASRLVSLFKKNNKSDEISVLPMKPSYVISSQVTHATNNTLGQSSERRLLDSDSGNCNLWAKATKPASPSAPLCSPIRGPPASENSMYQAHPLSSEEDMDEEIAVPLVFDDFDVFESPSGDINSSAPYPQVKNMEGMNRKELVLEGQNERYTEGLDWVRGPLLGTGAFSACYQAWDITTGTIMAVKQVSFCRNTLEEQDRVEKAVRQELEVLRTLRHENIVRMIGATRQSTHFNMFVEWMAGGSVAGLLERYGSFSERVILNYTQQMLCGLSYLHHKHILHRDLKGANLLVDSSGKHLRIGDLGTAAKLQAARTLSGEFQGQLLGTIAFMAPEVLRGEDYGRSCDIWSVGCCMIEMATTRPPWRESNASNHLALMYKIACSREPPKMPDSLLGVARKLALDCLQVNSEQRPSAKMLLQSYTFTSIQSNAFSAEYGENNFDSGCYCYDACPEDLEYGLSRVQTQSAVTTVFSLS